MNPSFTHPNFHENTSPFSFGQSQQDQVKKRDMSPESSIPQQYFPTFSFKEAREEDNLVNNQYAIPKTPGDTLTQGFSTQIQPDLYSTSKDSIFTSYFVPSSCMNQDYSIPEVVDSYFPIYPSHSFYQSTTDASWAINKLSHDHNHHLSNTHNNNRGDSSLNTYFDYPEQLQQQIQESPEELSQRSRSRSDKKKKMQSKDHSNLLNTKRQSQPNKHFRNNQEKNSPPNSEQKWGFTNDLQQKQQQPPQEHQKQDSTSKQSNTKANAKPAFTQKSSAEQENKFTFSTPLKAPHSSGEKGIKDGQHHHHENNFYQFPYAFPNQPNSQSKQHELTQVEQIYQNALPSLPLDGMRYYYINHPQYPSQNQDSLHRPSQLPHRQHQPQLPQSVQTQFEITQQYGQIYPEYQNFPQFLPHRIPLNNVLQPINCNKSSQQSKQSQSSNSESQSHSSSECSSNSSRSNYCNMSSNSSRKKNFDDLKLSFNQSTNPVKCFTEFASLQPQTVSIEKNLSSQKPTEADTSLCFTNLMISNKIEQINSVFKEEQLKQFIDEIPQAKKTPVQQQILQESKSQEIQNRIPNKVTNQQKKSKILQESITFPTTTNQKQNNIAQPAYRYDENTNPQCQKLLSPTEAQENENPSIVKQEKLKRTRMTKTKGAIHQVKTSNRIKQRTRKQTAISSDDEEEPTSRQNLGGKVGDGKEFDDGLPQKNKFDTKNLVKNFLNQLVSFVMSEESIVKSLLSFSQSDLQEYQEKLKLFFKNKKFNRSLLKEFIHVVNYRIVFAYFLEHRAQDWIAFGRMKDKPSHFRALSNFVYICENHGEIKSWRFRYNFV